MDPLDTDAHTVEDLPEAPDNAVDPPADDDESADDEVPED